MNLRINLADLTGRLRETIVRFPATILASVTGTVAIIALVYLDGLGRNSTSPHEAALFNLILVSLIGLTFTLSATLMGEGLRLKRGVIWFLQAVAVLLCIAYYFLLPDKPTIYYLIQIASFIIAFHLLVAVAAYLVSSRESFWGFNKAAFIRIIIAAIYSGTLTAGLELALVAMDLLFGFDIDDRVYGYLFFIMAGVVNTLLFLSELPYPHKAPDDYPKGLKVFTQGVLVPLTILYFIILVAYTGKIIIQWQWPEGFVSAMILGYSVLGMLSYLLVYPLRHGNGVLWIRIFSKWFFISLLPFSVLLYLAVYVRVADYGLTVPRYIGVIIAVWLAGTALYFILSKGKDIRVVPASLAFIVLLFSFGPWGLYHVSLNSQYNRLTEYLEKYDRLEAPYTGKDNIPDEDAAEMRRLIRYVLNMDGKQLLRPYHTSLSDSVWDSYNLNDEITENWEIQLSNTQQSYSHEDDYTLRTEGPLTLDKPARFTNMIYFNKQDFGGENVILRCNDDEILASIDCDTLLSHLPDPETGAVHPVSDMIYHYIRPGGDTVHIWFRQIQWTEKDGKFSRVGNYYGMAWW